MATSENAKIEYESGQGYVSSEALTDSGDRQIFTFANDIVSNAKGKKPTIKPDGIVTGIQLISTAASGSNDVVDVAAFTAYSGGVLQTVTAQTDVSLTRATPSDTHIINSITMNSSGAVAVVVGTDGTSFSETRAAAGGPPLIPVGSVELGQVRLSSNSAGVVASTEIYQVVGEHTELSNFPIWETNNIGQGLRAESTGQVNAFVKFQSALENIHVGPATKQVYAEYYTPIFAEVEIATDFVPAEESQTTNSTTYYRKVVSSVSRTLNQGSFTALVGDGITHPLLRVKNDNVTVKFFSDEDESPFILMQGTLATSRSFPAEDQNAAAVTVSSEFEAADFNG